MNTTKLLCKYLDEENKGYVDGEDIICATILEVAAILFITIISANLGEFLRVYLFNLGELSITEIAIYSPLNVLIGVVTLASSGLIIFIAYMLIKMFSKHKFVTCERDDTK